MVGLMMVTFLFFFCFVVNVGMLVNAKINLQNAADLAAYAGAAVQARQLNSIAYLNYEMRRQYKKYLFRYFVIGTMAYNTAPTAIAQTAGTTPRSWKPAGPNGKNDYKLPMVCMIFNANDNFCQLDVSPAIVAPQASTFDAINSALDQALQQIEAVRENNCVAIGAVNEAVLLLWLWNTDPTLKNLTSQLLAATAASGPSAAVAAKYLEVITGLSQGLGIVPRNLILRQRINTLQSYVNAASQTGVTPDVAAQLRAGKDPSEYERTIQAFYSAYLTLGNHTFADTSAISMDELMPVKNGAAQLLSIKDITAKFDAYSVNFTLKPHADGIVASDCVPQADLQQVKDGLTLGVQKDPAMLTYYAIRLRAKANVLFNPFGANVELTAYSAARPFGSRIGPRLSQTDFTWANAVPGQSLTSTNVSTGQTNQLGAIEPFNLIPNLPITLNDGTNLGQGWDTNETDGTLFSTAFPGDIPDPTRGGTPIISSNQLEQAYQIAMSPNPYEEGFYNIPSNLDIHYAPMFDGTQTMTLWAPVAPPANPGGAATQIQSVMNDVIQETDPQATAFKAAVTQQLLTYLNSELAAGQGEDGETMNTVRIHNPFYTEYDPTANPNPTPITLPEWMMPSLTQDQLKIMTSWNSPSDPTITAGGLGRSGYSVKFVTLSSLMSPDVTTSDLNTSMNNTINDPLATADLGIQVQH